MEKNQKNAEENANRAHASIYLKQILNYSQILAIIITINFKWPYYVNSYFQITSFLGSISNQALTFDCLINDFKIKESPIHIKFAIFTLLPFLIWVLMILLSVFLHFKNKKNSINKEKILTYFIIISNYLQPFILQTIFDNLKCKRLDGRLFLYKEMMIDCESENHQFWVS